MNAETYRQTYQELCDKLKAVFNAEGLTVSFEPFGLSTYPSFFCRVETLRQIVFQPIQVAEIPTLPVCTETVSQRCALILTSEQIMICSKCPEYVNTLISDKLAEVKAAFKPC